MVFFGFGVNRDSSRVQDWSRELNRPCQPQCLHIGKVKTQAHQASKGIFSLDSGHEKHFFGRQNMPSLAHKSSDWLRLSSEHAMTSAMGVPASSTLKPCQKLNKGRIGRLLGSLVE